MDEDAKILMAAINAAVRPGYTWEGGWLDGDTVAVVAICVSLASVTAFRAAFSCEDLERELSDIGWLATDGETVSERVLRRVGGE